MWHSLLLTKSMDKDGPRNAIRTNHDLKKGKYSIQFAYYQNHLFECIQIYGQETHSLFITLLY